MLGAGEASPALPSAVLIVSKETEEIPSGIVLGDTLVSMLSLIWKQRSLLSGPVFALYEHHQDADVGGVYAADASSLAEGEGLELGQFLRAFDA